ncbi:OprD family outer membrane porin [Belliella sp. DSM 111904]|uniref:OprD family outer membrane porin n=1 Tax=Belliella filtrata TaxID=2923435 RepID=A0ABS9V3M2_9BACT|nr:OprD family outer membrane porin [Belliella filtrata]MCH7410814.1 OprD family outer membrane porin [Belliella filtrata]
MIRILALWILLLIPSFVFSSQSLDTAVVKGSSLKSDLKRGEFDFHFRSYFMSTLNKGPLIDYATLAAGTGIGYTSPEWGGFQFRFNGFFTYQVFEQNVRIADPITNAGNRYEILLYDMNDIENTNRLDRLEELYIAYRRERLKFVLGRQKVNSPLVNDQDNRMRPNIFQGLSATYSGLKIKTTMMWVNQVNIRGTVDWYKIDDSFGVYSFGRNPFGEPSNYSDNIKSKGLGIIGVQFHDEGLTGQLWNYTADNVFNMSFGQVEYISSLTKSTRLHLGLQGFHQLPIRDGGNPDTQLTYMLPSERSSGVGAKVGVFKGKHNFSFNYLAIDDKGRFLFPREWGRERFFASLPRERFEGAGDMQAYTFKYDTITGIDGLIVELGAGLVNHSGMNAYTTNKYGIPSYYHFVGQLEYRFKDYYEGLNLQLLAVNKAPKNGDNLTDEMRINRVGMWNLNFIIDYRF